MKNLEGDLIVPLNVEGLINNQRIKEILNFSQRLKENVYLNNHSLSKINNEIPDRIVIYRYNMKKYVESEQD